MSRIKSAARSNADTFVIRGRSQLRAMGTPQRVQIVEALAGTAPRSIREIAGVLGRPAAALYHHVEALLGAGLIVDAGVRGEGRRAERTYRLVAPSLQAAPPRSAAERRELARVGETHARYVLRRFSRAMQAGSIETEDGVRRTAVRHLSLHLTQRELAELNRDIEALTTKWSKARSGDNAVSLLVMFAPEKA